MRQVEHLAAAYDHVDPTVFLRYQPSKTVGTPHNRTHITC